MNKKKKTVSRFASVASCSGEDLARQLNGLFEISPFSRARIRRTQLAQCLDRDGDLIITALVNYEIDEEEAVS